MRNEITKISYLNRTKKFQPKQTSLIMCPLLPLTHGQKLKCKMLIIKMVIKGPDYEQISNRKHGKGNRNNGGTETITTVLLLYNKTTHLISNHKVKHRINYNVIHK